MNIGIITHYDVHNHGALLQLYALIQVLNQNGHKAKALTYKKNYDYMEAGLESKYNISIRSLFWYISYIKKIGIRRAVFNILKKEILDKFRRPLQGEYYSRANELNAVFVGSDEVFSVENGINTFFFGYGVPCRNIYAYAGCCGPTTMENIKEKRLEGFIKEGINLFKKVSVRDDNTKEILTKLTGIDFPVVCDPVILYGYKNELQNLNRKIKQDYLLIYSYDNNMNDADEVEKIREFAYKNNLKIISAGFYHKWCDRSADASPIEILSYFKYAKYVITDTFHGSVMSLICNTQFAVKLRKNKNKLYDLLNRYAVADRVIDDFSNIEKILDFDIDYIKVNALLEESRIHSINYIDSCLEDVDNE